MGRTRNFKTRNPYKLIATSRQAGPHESFKRQGRKRGGARNEVREYMEGLDNDWSRKDQEEEDDSVYREVCGPFDGDDE